MQTRWEKRRVWMSRWMRMRSRISGMRRERWRGDGGVSAAIVVAVAVAVRKMRMRWGTYAGFGGFVEVGIAQRRNALSG